MKSFKEGEKEAIKKEAKAQSDQLVSAMNQLNADAWSMYYVKDVLLSTIVSTDYWLCEVHGWI